MDKEFNLKALEDANAIALKTKLYIQWNEEDSFLITQSIESTASTVLPTTSSAVAMGAMHGFFSSSLFCYKIMCFIYACVRVCVSVHFLPRV